MSNSNRNGRFFFGIRHAIKKSPWQPFRLWGSNSHVELHDNYYIYIYIYVYIYTYISCLACLSSRSSRRSFSWLPRGCRIWMGYTLKIHQGAMVGHGGPWWAMASTASWPGPICFAASDLEYTWSIWSWDHLNISGIHGIHGCQVLYHLDPRNSSEFINWHEFE